MHKRTKRQKQRTISLPMNEEFISRIDSFLPKLGYSDRAKFIRQAIVDKFAAAGIVIPVELSLAPMRTGKVGRPRKK